MSSASANARNEGSSHNRPREGTRQAMPYVINCPHCKNQMQLGDTAAGKQFRCPFCKNAFVAPPPGAAQPPAQEPALAGAAAAGSAGSVSGSVSRPAAPPPGKGSAPAPRPQQPAAPTSCPACGSKL